MNGFSMSDVTVRLDQELVPGQRRVLELLQSFEEDGQVRRRAHIAAQLAAAIDAYGVLLRDALAPLIAQVPQAQPDLEQTLESHQRLQKLAAALDTLCPTSTRFDQIIRRLSLEFQRHLRQEQALFGLVEQEPLVVPPLAAQQERYAA